MSKMSRIDQFFTYLLLTGLGALLAAPFMYMISMALASDATSSKLTFTFIPGEFHFENFVRISLA